MIGSPKPSPQTSTSESKKAEVRLGVQRAFEGNPELTQRQLTGELRISPGGVSYAVKGIVERALVKMKNIRHLNHRAPYFCVVTPSGIANKAFLVSAHLSLKYEGCD